VLDRFLKVINTIDLRRHGILQASAVALSYDNNYWVFDAVENKLKKMDDNGNILLSTPDFRTIFNESFLPETIIDNDGFVYLYNKNQGCLMFDYYGAFKQKLSITGLNFIEVVKNNLYGFDSSHLHQYNTKTFNEISYQLNLNNTSKLQTASNTLFALKQDGMHVYSIK
jgi:hypothetical protein